MPDTLLPIRIFISSPGDLSLERNIVKEVIADLNRSPHYLNRFKLIHYAYEDSTPPRVGTSAQTVVDNYLLRPDEADILICLMWLRMGTPTPDLIDPETKNPYKSGTEYEFLTAYRANQQNNKPLVFLYRCIRPPEDMKRFDPDQYQRILQFFDRFNSDGNLKGFIKEFRDTPNLKNILQNDLENILQHDFNEKSFRLQQPTRNSIALQDLYKEAKQWLGNCKNYKPLDVLETWNKLCSERWFIEMCSDITLEHVQDYFKALEKYSMLPHGIRGKGHLIESWVKLNDLDGKFAKLQKELLAIVSVEE